MGRGRSSGSRCLPEIKDRGTKDAVLVVSDGLTEADMRPSLPTWPLAIHQTCVIHSRSSTFRYASRRDWSEISADPRTGRAWPPRQAAARARFDANAPEV
ncbi:MAG: transposase, partial [Actinomycetales bacterium]